MFTVGQCPLVESWSALLHGARAMRAASVKRMVRVAQSGLRASSEGAVVYVQRAVKGLPAIANKPLPHRWPAVGSRKIVLVSQSANSIVLVSLPPTDAGKSVFGGIFSGAIK
jgi:hypothetical protein